MSKKDNTEDTRYIDISYALMSIADMFGDGGHELLNILLPLARMFTGDSVVWDTVFAANTGDRGLFNEYQQRKLGRMRSSISREFQREQLRRHIDSIERTLHAEPDYDPTANGGLSYNDYIDSLVNAKMAKGGLRWLYEQFVAPTDWDDSWTVGQNLGKVAYSQARRHMLTENTHGLSFGKYLAGNIFTGTWDDSIGNFIQKDTFKAENWGNFTRKGVSEIAAALSENMDFYKDVTGNLPANWRSAMERFRQTLKEYTDALAPLKDIMGNDTAKMIKAMESITGQRFSSMQPTHVASLANELAIRSISGQWTMGEYTGMLTDVTKELAKMTGISPWGYISAPQQAMQAMDISSGLARPSFLTDTQWKAVAKERVVQTNNSKAADLFAKTYALWAEQPEQQADGADKSFSRFMSLVTEAAGDGGDVITAARKLANAPYDYILNSAMASPYYREVMLNGQAGRMDRIAYTQRTKNLLTRFIGMDTAFMTGVGIDVKSENAATEARNIFSRVLDIVSTNGEIMQMSEQQRITYLHDTLGITDGADRLSRALTYMENNTTYNPILVALSADANEKDMEKYMQAYKHRAAVIKAINANIYDSDNGIHELFSGGWSNRRLVNYITASKMLGDTQSIEEAEAIISASGILGEQIYGTSESNEKNRAEFSRGVYAYSVSTEAKSNIGFLNALDKYKTLYQRMRKLDENSDEYKSLMPEAQRLSNLMLAYKEAGDAVDMFMSADIWENGVRLTGEAAEQAKHKRIAEFIINSRSTPGKDNKVKQLSEHFKYARMDDLIKNYDGSDKQNIHALFSDFLKYQDKNDTDNILSLTERWNDFYTEKRKVLKEGVDSDALDKLDKMIRATNNTTSTDTSYQDRLLQVLEAIERFLSEIRGKVFGE